MPTDARPGFFKRTAWFWFLILVGLVVDLLAWGMAALSAYKLPSSAPPFAALLPMLTLLNHFFRSRVVCGARKT